MFEDTVFPSVSGGFARPGCVPAQFVGIPQATLQQWLTDAQTALHQLQTGAKATTVLYNSGEGSRQVTYTRASQAGLQQYVRQLTAALGLTGPRRPIRVGFCG